MPKLGLKILLSLSQSFTFSLTKLFLQPTKSLFLSHAQNFDLKKYFFSLSKTLSHQVPFSLSKPKSFETQIITYSLCLSIKLLSHATSISYLDPPLSLSLPLSLTNSPSQTNKFDDPYLSFKQKLSIYAYCTSTTYTLSLCIHLSLTHTAPSISLSFT